MRYHLAEFLHPHWKFWVQILRQETLLKHVKISKLVSVAGLRAHTISRKLYHSATILCQALAIYKCGTSWVFSQ